ncbi:MAG: tRNA (guanosine(37)-N1)-methyltransferase TrmD [Bacillota bacterium]
MKFYVVTLFPGMFAGVLGSSILKRAQAEGLVAVELVDPRDFATDAHHTVDDYPYGGGPGMVLKPEPVYAALDWVKERACREPFVVLLSPQGKTFDSGLAKELARREEVCLVAGHYEGFDERIRAAADLELSIGDFVLTGGEIAAMAVMDAVSRFLPGVLGDDASAHRDSFSDGLLEGPQYTRPSVFRDMPVPQALLVGDHASVYRWRRKEALRRTYRRRPDLLRSATLTFEDRLALREVIEEEATSVKE